MRHDVHVPTGLPLAVRRIYASTKRNPRVRAEQVNRTNVGFGLLNDPLHIFLATHVGGHGNAISGLGGLASRLFVDIDCNHGACALSHEPGHERFANTVTPAGNDDYFVS
jgi:hypothetical protein